MAVTKNIFFWIIAAIVLGAAALFYAYAPHTVQNAAPAESTMTSLPTETVIIGTTTIKVEIASTDAEREQGLSDRAGLAANSGMLFVFDSAARVGFWMKDMNFDLDMIFADAQGKIVTVDSNVPASSYNASDPSVSQVFYPSEPAQYVLEVPAGFALMHDITVGERITFN